MRRFLPFLPDFSEPVRQEYQAIVGGLDTNRASVEENGAARHAAREAMKLEYDASLVKTLHSCGVRELKLLQEEAALRGRLAEWLRAAHEEMQRILAEHDRRTEARKKEIRKQLAEIGFDPAVHGRDRNTLENTERHFAAFVEYHVEIVGMREAKQKVKRLADELLNPPENGMESHNLQRRVAIREAIGEATERMSQFVNAI